MGRFFAIAIALGLGACGKKSAPDDCMSGKDEFLAGLKHTFDQRVAGAPDQANAKAFFDGKYEHARAGYEAYCTAVTEDDWKCMHEVVESGRPPTDACKPAADRFMKVVLDEDHPDY